MGLVRCQGCNRLVSEFLPACPNCRQPVALEISRSCQFCEQWLLLGKIIIGLSLLGLLTTFVAGSTVLADFFTRASLLATGILGLGKICQWVLFKRRG